MALNPYLAKKLVEFTNNEEGIKSCIEFGNQRFHVNEKEIASILKKLGKETSDINFNDSNESLYDKTRRFYKILGIEKYNAIDLNGFDGSYEFDLNQDIKEVYEFHDTFDLVMNNGTSEHVFDQKNVFLNSHNLCSKDGYMLHMLPFFSWINHGFYNFNPILFFDLAIANNYEIIDFGIGSRSEELILSDKNKSLDFDKTQAEKGLSLFFENEATSNKTFSNLFIKKLTKASIERIKSLYSKDKRLTFAEFCENVVFPHKGRNLFRQMLRSFKAQDNLGESPFVDLSILVLMKKTKNQAFAMPFQGKYRADYDKK